MSRRALSRSRRGGVLLDLIVAFGLIVLMAFVLVSFGVTFHELMHGVEHFFGIG